jgi:hypothetical protein
MGTSYGPIVDTVSFQRRDKTGVLFAVTIQRHPEEDLTEFFRRVETSVGSVLDVNTASR